MKNIFNDLFAFLQKIGKALMLPVAILPAAGILLGVGSAGFGIFPDVVNELMKAAGGAVFGNLALLFAVGLLWDSAKMTKFPSSSSLTRGSILCKVTG